MVSDPCRPPTSERVTAASSLPVIIVYYNDYIMSTPFQKIFFLKKVLTFPHDML